MLWMPGGRIRFEFPVTATVIVGELGSRAKVAWGAAPTDGCSTLASTRLWRRESSAVRFKAFMRWSSLWLLARRRRPELAWSRGDGGDFWNLPLAKGLGTLL